MQASPNDWVMRGCQAVSNRELFLHLPNECNRCTLDQIHHLFGSENTDLIGGDEKGVDVYVAGDIHVIWFDSIPDRCNCKL